LKLVITINVSFLLVTIILGSYISKPKEIDYVCLHNTNFALMRITKIHPEFELQRSINILYIEIKQ
jgi:hypothetical protein